jgi:hypothetical protein
VADTPPPAAPKSTGTFGFLTRKIGPVPVWLIAVVAIGAWYWYEHYGPGAAAAATAAPEVEDVEEDIQGPTSSAGAPAAAGFGGLRETAPGRQSLNAWAAAHGTTAGAVIGASEAAYTAGKLTAPNHARFDQYLNKGSAAAMPKGLVFYAPPARSATAAAAAAVPPAAAAAPAAIAADPSAGTGGSTSGPAIAAAESPPKVTAAAKPVARPVATARPAAAGGGQTRWRTPK